MTTETIAIDSLSKSYPREQVLRDITIEIEDGEFCVVVGPSGCGKTTLLDCIAGLEAPDSGTISFFGRDVTRLSARERRVGYVFQEFEETLFPHKTTAENVAFGLEHGDADLSDAEIDDRIDELLSLLAIEGARDSRPRELSGGQQQRVELARQLARDCDLMLFDDPLSDLDYKLGKRMELEMRRIHRERGDTFVYVTHNQDQALKLADRIVVMNDGVIEQTGTPTEVYDQPANAFVARFVGDSNVLVGTLEHADEEVRVETDVGSVAATGVGEGLAVGTESPLIVRPEDVAIGESAADSDNRFEATLEGSTYMGERTEFTFSLAQLDEEIICVEPGNPTVGSAGDTVTIGWDSTDAKFFASLSETDAVTVETLMRL